MTAPNSLRVSIAARLLIAALLVAPGATLAQLSSAFPPDAASQASALLNSDAARFLSGSGKTALKVISGATAPASAGPSGFSASAVMDANPFVSSDAQVLVNNPAQDGIVGFVNDVTSQSETAVAGIGNIVVVAFNDSSELLTSNSLMGYSRSTDRGHSFTDLGAIPTGSIAGAANLGDPGLVVQRKGVFYASAIAFNPDPLRTAGFSNTLSVSKSTDGGITFGNPVFIPAGGVLAGGFQDKEAIAVDNSGKANDGNVYVGWSSFPPNNAPQFSLPIFFSRSVDGGNTFSVPMRISGPGNGINQGTTIAVGPGGDVYVAWLQFSPVSGIFVAKSVNGGASFNPPVFVAPVNIIGFGSGNLFGNFRVNSFPNMDVSPINGLVYITYASMPNPFPNPNPNGSDVYFVRSVTGGANWSAPLRLNDVPTGDQFFPVLAANSRGEIRAIWYDRRNDPNNLRIELFSAVSTNAGVSFSANEKVDVGPGAFPAVGYDPLLIDTYMGDYIDIKAEITATGRGGDFLLSWADFKRTITTPGGTRPDQDVYFTRK